MHYISICEKPRFNSVHTVYTVGKVLADFAEFD